MSGPAIGPDVRSSSESLFTDLASMELIKVDAFALLLRDAIFEELRDARRNYREICRRRAPTEEERQVALAKLDDLGYDITFLYEFRYLNFHGFSKILKKYDKICMRRRSKGWFFVKVKESDFYNLDFDTLLAGLALGYRQGRCDSFVKPNASFQQRAATASVASENLFLQKGLDLSSINNTPGDAGYMRYVWIPDQHVVWLKVKLLRFFDLDFIDGLSEYNRQLAAGKNVPDMPQAVRRLEAFESKLAEPLTDPPIINVNRRVRKIILDTADTSMYQTWFDGEMSTQERYANHALAESCNLMHVEWGVSTAASAKLRQESTCTVQQGGLPPDQVLAAACEAGAGLRPMARCFSSRTTFAAPSASYN